MSLVATSWAWQQQGMSPAQKMVLLAIADHHNESTGLCCVSMKTVAKRACVGYSSCRRHAEHLETIGLITRVRRSREGGMLGSYNYRFGAMFHAPKSAPADTNDSENASAQNERSANTANPLQNTSAQNEPSSALTAERTEPKERSEVEDQRSSTPPRETLVTTSEPDEETARLCQLLADLITARDPRAKVAPARPPWLTEMRRLRAVDGRSVEDIEMVIRWAQADGFWQSNVLSPGKLRKQFTALWAKANTSRRRSSAAPSTVGLGRANPAVVEQAAADAWAKARVVLKADMNQADWDLWVEPLTAVSLNGHLTLAAPAGIAAWVNTRLKPTLQQATGCPIRIAVATVPTNTTGEPA